MAAGRLIMPIAVLLVSQAGCRSEETDMTATLPPITGAQFREFEQEPLDAGNRITGISREEARALFAAPPSSGLGFETLNTAVQSTLASSSNTPLFCPSLSACVPLRLQSKVQSITED